MKYEDTIKGRISPFLDKTSYEFKKQQERTFQMAQTLVDVIQNDPKLRQMIMDWGNKIQP